MSAIFRHAISSKSVLWNAAQTGKCRLVVLSIPECVSVQIILAPLKNHVSCVEVRLKCLLQEETEKTTNMLEQREENEVLEHVAAIV